jgi:putative ABC transport system ATP-binding protein
VWARKNSTVIGYIVQAFRERLGSASVPDTVEHRPLSLDCGP